MTCSPMYVLLVFALVVVSYHSAAVEFDYRPQYHVTLPNGWIGAARSNYLLGISNQYHIFFECHVNSTAIPSIAEKEWCHVHSTDLAHWTHDPQPGFPPVTDSASVSQLPIWRTKTNNSTVGVAALQWKDKTILGFSTDSFLLQFSNFSGESVLPKPAQPNISELADPYIWTDGKLYYIIVTASTQSGGPVVLLYKSETLTDDPLAWKSQGIFWQPKGKDIQNHGFFSYFELQAPDTLNLTSSLMYSDKSLFLTKWMTGRVNETAGTFLDAGSGLVDYGNMALGSVLTDATGRTVVIGTINESCSVTWARENGWSGALSLPRTVQLNSDKRTISFPVTPEVNALRAEYMGLYENLEVANGTLDMNAFRGDQLLIHALLSLTSTGSPFEAGIHVLASEDERTTVSVKTDKTQDLCESGALLKSIDLPGSDYDYFKMDEPDVKVCQSACCNDLKCHAWTMVVHEPATGNPKCPHNEPCCFLKSAIPQARPSSLNLTSGTAQAVLSLSTLHSSTSAEAPGKVYSAPFSDLNIGENEDLLRANGANERKGGDKKFCNGQGNIELDTYRGGSPYKVHRLDVLDPAKCRSYCCDDKHCQAWVLENSTETSILCLLKSKVMPSEPRPGYISGIGTYRSSIGVDLQIFIDHSIVEVFVNNGQSVMTARAYPRNPESIGVKLFANNSAVTFLKVEAWKMDSANL